MRATPKPGADARATARPARPPTVLHAVLRMLRLTAPRGLDVRTRLLIFAVLGMIVGTLLDALHVYNGAAEYLRVAEIPVLHVAWYVPIEFAFAGVAVGMIRPELDEELRRRRTDIMAWQVLLGLVCLGEVWAGSGLLTKAGVPNDRIAVLLTFIALVVWLVFDRTWQGILAGLITAGLGVGAEAGISLTGTYRYTQPDFIGVPCWLPSLYMTACIAGGNAGRFLKYSWDTTGWGEPAGEKDPA